MQQKKLARPIAGINQAGVWLWWRLPLGRRTKEGIKGLVFSCFPFLFRGSRAFKNWDYSKRMQGVGFTAQLSDFPEHWPLERIDPGVISPAESLQKTSHANSNVTEPLAIIVHVFYKDIFSEILNYLDPFKKIKCKLFIGTTRELFGSVNSIVEEAHFDHTIEVFENRGRDILPFIKLAGLAAGENFPLVLKLHTKRSDHRLSGDLWRKEVFKKLLSPVAVERILEVFRENPTVGLIGPAGHIVPMSLYYGGNAKAVSYLCYRLRFDPGKLENMNFIAGSMFYARTKALKPLLILKLDEPLFEEEKRQHDGTMAHAVERVIAVSNSIAGFTMVDSSSTSSSLKTIVTKDHPFTW